MNTVPSMGNNKGIQTYASIAKKEMHVSVIGWITGDESKKAKILSIGSSDLKLGCMLKEYDEQWEIRAEEILDKLGDIPTNSEIDWKRKILFVKFRNLENVKKAKESQIEVENKQILFQETYEYGKEYKILTIPSISKTTIWKLVDDLYNEINSIGDVIDITALKHESKERYLSKNLKLSIKFNKEVDIPTHIESCDEKLALCGLDLLRFVLNAKR
ncbi:hypothetical protein AYI70_g58 [Smittium culicis]|uniref:Uncharacterized protein n=1 Tax=Smittium culicis TaxID=133412 RepID=A0A1R1YI21_9FUNG|nr:hypothetical protein AYI70_g58 [Smittium culicis]